jgi:hypothetical protein
VSLPLPTLPYAYRQPAEAVLVRRDGRWLDGDLRAWRRDVDGWLGFVNYSASPGIRWLQWVDAGRVREA